MSRRFRPTAFGALACYLALLAYGLVFYPDGPYKPCAASAGYCGKSGKRHTYEDYRAQQLWERMFLISSPFGILSGIYLARSGKGASGK